MSIPVPPQPTTYQRDTPETQRALGAQFIPTSQSRVPRTAHDVELQAEFNNLGKGYLDEFFSKYGVSVDSIIALGYQIAQKLKNRHNLTPNDVKTMGLKCSDIILDFLLKQGKIDQAKYQEIHKYIFMSNFVATNLMSLFDEFSTTPISEAIQEYWKDGKSCLPCFTTKQERHVIYKGVN